ncbi:hypothetical protein EAF04_005028 [Stromatinia cepivora]|nr:hypothetical protein EAF04_005028 [Stromatinia cepivora]
MKNSHTLQSSHRALNTSVLCEKNISKRSASAFEENNDNPIEPSRKRSRLTRENLQIFEMQSSNPNTFTQSQASQAPPLSTTKTSNTSKTSRTKSISASDSAFGDTALNNHIYDHMASLKAANLECWVDICNRSRDSGSPDEMEYEDYNHNIASARSEAGIVQHSQKLFKEYKGVSEHGYRKSFNEALSHIPSNMGSNNGLSPAQPDLLEGYDLTKFRPYPIQEELRFAILKPGMNATTLAHFAGEWKGPGRDLRQAEIQAAYDGAIMVCGRKEALSSLGRSDPDNCAYVATFTSDGTILSMDSHHSTFDGKTTEYHQTLIKKIMLTGSYDEYKRGLRMMRNVQDFTKNNASSLKDDLVSSWKSANNLTTEDTNNLTTENTNNLTTENTNNLITEDTDIIVTNNSTHIDDLSQSHLIDLPQSAKEPFPRPRKCPKAKPKHPSKQVTKHRYSTRNNRLSIH